MHILRNKINLKKKRKTDRPIISILGRPRKDDLKFKVSLACVTRPCLRNDESKEVFMEQMIDMLLLKE